MAQKTDLNVAPYYDDYSSNNNYLRTLFRPGFAIQARELTQLQSTLQNQIGVHGSHMFKEGSMVIPGQIHFGAVIPSLKLASTYAGETIVPSQYIGTIITGDTTGVQAEVIYAEAATTVDQPLLYLRYISSGFDKVTKVFADGENIRSNTSVTHTTTYDSQALSATTFTSTFSNDKKSSVKDLQGPLGPASSTGTMAHLSAGVYYVRGHFVEVDEQIVILTKYSNRPSGRIGFHVEEKLLAPEDESSLLDNATGSTNFAAKGAHRLQINLTLTKRSPNTEFDENFIELMNLDRGVVQTIINKPDYNILEATLARRTFDESGNYIVRPFSIIARESVTVNENVGVYSVRDHTDQGRIASDAMLSLQVSPGKAYIKGYEVEKNRASFIDLRKSRDLTTVNAGQTLFSMGNYTLIDNVYGTPDISSISGETTAYKTITLYPENISTRGSVPALTSSDNTIKPIGQCRARAIEYDSGTVGTTDARFKIYLFDIRMFTYITLSGTPSATLTANFANGGVKITGSTSGATGFVVNNIATTSGTQLVVIKTSGRFSNGETFTASDSTEGDQIVEDSDNTNLTMVASEGADADNTFAFEQVRSMVMVDDDTGQNFTADLVLEPPRNRKNVVNNLALDGTDAGGANANNIQTLEENDGFGGILLETPLLPRLVDSDKNNALEKLPKQTIRTLLTDTNDGLTDTQYTVRRQFIGTTNTSGVVSFSAGSNETFVSHAEKDYTLSILTAGGGTGVQGQLVSIADTMTGNGTTTLTITDSTILGSAAKVKVVATILKTSVSPKLKTTQLMKQLKVSTGTSDAYGTRPDDREISLGRADAFKLVGVFDSQDTSTDAVAPTLTLTGITGTFTRGEKITGETSGATGRVISTSSPISYVSTNSLTFSASETITGESSTATATVSSSTDGDIVLTSRYTLDTGQRDNFYDIARIVRKKGASAPIGKLLVVYDYFEHGAGDFFSVDSYSDVAKQMEYDDIPTYSATKIDTDDPKPSGQFPLYDTYDFRPRVDDVAGTSTSLSAVDEITGNSFNFYERTFEGTGGSTVDMPKPGSFVQSDFEYYLPRFATLNLSAQGRFYVTHGDSSDAPLLPKTKDDSILLATMFVPAYTFDPSHVTIKRERHQRYRMRDIGKLAKRLDHVEYYTALSLLERDAESFEVTDENGLNRFKSGFVVDNFQGHRIGDTAHKDYKNSMDFELGQLRPTHRSKSIDLQEKVTIDTLRTAAGYQKTGDLLTLPYSSEELTKQPYATRTERVNPFYTASWIGDITLSPPSDVWFETDVFPDVIINEEGDYDAVLAKAANNLGTVWNSWQTQWSGTIESLTENWAGSEKEINPNDSASTRTTQSVRTDQTKTGVNTQTSLRTDSEKQGERTLSTATIPVVRSRTITFTGENFKPNTRLYAFFNKTSVSAYVTPASSTYTTASPIVAGSALITTSTGKIEGTFVIPDPKVTGNPQWPVGEINFRLTSNPFNGPVATAFEAGTAGNATFTSSGLLNTEEVISTRESETKSKGYTDDDISEVIVDEGTVDPPPPPPPPPPSDPPPPPPPITWPPIENPCVSPETLILLIGGKTKPAGEIKVGDILYTQHEESLEWGEYPVSYASIVSGSERLKLTFDHTDLICSPSHKFYVTGKGWTVVTDMKVGDIVSEHKLISVSDYEAGDVVKLTVKDAHTYISANMLSHNKSPVQPNPPPPPPPIPVDPPPPPPAPVKNNYWQYDETEGTHVLTGWTDDLWNQTQAELYEVLGDEAGISSNIIIAPSTAETDYDLFEYHYGYGGQDPYGTGSVEPLAQTFVVKPSAVHGVNTKSSTSGAFLTSVELYFESKDDDVPVTLELRNVVNGYPGPKILPFSRVVKNGADVNTSSTAATATTFTFDSPVFVEDNVEYCITLWSNSPKYKAWISRMGETDIGGTRTVSEQPHVGVLYKSHNNTGFSMSPMEDLKFTLNHAKFSATSGKVTLTNKAVPSRTLGTDPLDITDASTVLKVNHSDNHMHSTSNNVTISGVKSAATTTLNGAISATATTLTLASGTNFDDTSGVYSKLASNLWYIKIDDEIITYTTISGEAVSGASRAVNSTTAAEHADGATVELYQAYKVPFTEINATHTVIANPEIDSYTISLTTTPDVGSSDTAAFGGTEVVATENAIMDYMQTIIGTLEVPNTLMTAKALVCTATSPSGTQTSFNTSRLTSVPNFSFPLNENYKFYKPYMIASEINETNELSGKSSFEIEITMRTNDARLSPVIDTSRMSVVAVANRINNIDSSSDVYPTTDHVPSTAPEGDQNAAIYLTKQVTLDQLATGIKLIFAAHRPSSSEIKAMYKILRNDESSDFDDLSYEYFNTDGSADVTVNPSAQETDFQEYRFTAGVDDDGFGTPLDEFISFQIKIIMQGTNCAEPPRIRALRAIALGT
jgi:hypothetical protein